MMCFRGSSPRRRLAWLLILTLFITGVFISAAEEASAAATTVTLRHGRRDHYGPGDMATTVRWVTHINGEAVDLDDEPGVSRSYAYCVQPSKLLPDEGTYPVTIVDDDDTGRLARMRKLIYYLQGAYGYKKVTKKRWFSDNDTSADAYALGHIALSWIYEKCADDSDAWTGTDSAIKKKVKAMVKDLDNLDDPPDDFEIFWVKIAGHQDTLGAIYATEYGKAKVTKVSARPDLTEGNVNYSLNGAEYTLYNDAKCTDRASTKAGKKAVLTIGADGRSDAIEVETGRYYLKETKAPAGYALDSEIHSIDVAKGKTTKYTAVDVPKTNPVDLLIQKVDRETGSAIPQGAASLEGAEYTVTYYDAAAHEGMTEEEMAAAIEGRSPARIAGASSEQSASENGSGGDSSAEANTSANGTEGGNAANAAAGSDAASSESSSGAAAADGSNAASGEAAANGSSAADGSDAADSGNAASGNDAGGGAAAADGNNAASGEAATDGSSAACGDSAATDGSSTTAGDKTDGAASGEAAADGSNAADGSDSGSGAEAVWVYRTDARGRIDVTQPDKYLVSGPDMYRDSAERAVYPLGILRIEETKAPTGYERDTHVYYRGIYDSGDSETVSSLRTMTGEDAASEQVIRGDLKFTKTKDGSARMAGVKFRFTSKTTGESHILAADKNGNLNTSADWTPHTQNTNKGEDSTCGIWFNGLNDEEAGAKPDDSLGALPYDTYIMEEIASAENEGYELVSDTVTIERPRVTIDLGTYDDKKKTTTKVKDPDPALATEARDKATFTHDAAAASDMEFIDRVMYSGLEKGTSYTVEGVLMDKSTGKPLLDDKGREVHGVTEFVAGTAEGETEVGFHFSGKDLGGTDTVIYEYLKEDGAVIASHEDINSSSQTVKIRKVKTGTPVTTTVTDRPKTGDSSAVIVYAAAALAAMLELLILTAKRRNDRLN